MHEGKELFAKEFIHCDRVAVMSDRGWTHLTRKGIPAYEVYNLWAGNYQSICAVKNPEQEFFHIDLEGNPIYPERYTYLVI